MLKLKLQYFGHLMRRTDSVEKTLMLGKIEAGGEKGMTEVEMVGITNLMDMSLSELWELVMDGDMVMACCSRWGRKELDMTDD